MTTLQRKRIENAVAATNREPVLTIRGELARLLEEDNVSRDDLLTQLEAMRQRFREEGRETEEDLVSDLMDFFTGWSHSTLRL
jgi:hypothetical protein